MLKILTPEEEKQWLDSSITTEEAVPALLSVFPDSEMTAWAGRQKFNYGDPYDTSVIDPEEEKQWLDL